jgi:hypothetical protein
MGLREGCAADLVCTDLGMEDDSSFVAVLVSIIIPITTRNSQLLYHLPGPPQMKTVETSLVIAHRARQFALIPSTITACNAHTILNI